MSRRPRSAHRRRHAAVLALTTIGALLALGTPAGPAVAAPAGPAATPRAGAAPAALSPARRA
ncbi:hypothetical protein ACWGIA_25535, partial [Streptomyces bobili]